jgi:antitoxin component YwqK of YwqJK toxin-antitoxin module
MAWGVYNPFGPTSYSLTLVGQEDGTWLVVVALSHALHERVDAVAMIPDTVVRDRAALAEVLIECARRNGADHSRMIGPDMPTLVNVPQEGALALGLEVTAAFWIELAAHTTDELGESRLEMLDVMPAPDRAKAEQQAGLTRWVSRETAQAGPKQRQQVLEWLDIVTVPNHCVFETQFMRDAENDIAHSTVPAVGPLIDEGALLVGLGIPEVRDPEVKRRLLRLLVEASLESGVETTWRRALERLEGEISARGWSPSSSETRELYHENGQLKEKSTHVAGELDGPYESYYENGQLKAKGSYAAGEFDGPYELYHENGQLEGKGSYAAGEFDGPNESYYENGQLEAKGSYAAGEGDGPYELYHENGQLQAKGTHVAGGFDGPYESYYENGQLEAKKSNVAGHEDGPCESYHENGQLIWKGIFNMGVECGQWIEEGETVTYPPCPPGPEDGN